MYDIKTNLIIKTCSDERSDERMDNVSLLSSSSAVVIIASSDQVFPMLNIWDP